MVPGVCRLELELASSRGVYSRATIIWFQVCVEQSQNYMVPGMCRVELALSGSRCVQSRARIIWFQVCVQSRARISQFQLTVNLQSLDFKLIILCWMCHLSLYLYIYPSFYPSYYPSIYLYISLYWSEIRQWVRIRQILGQVFSLLSIFNQLKNNVQNLSLEYITYKQINRQ